MSKTPMCLACGQEAYGDLSARATRKANEDIAALIAVAKAAREYVDLFDTMNYPETAAMYPRKLRDALERMQEASK